MSGKGGAGKSAQPFRASKDPANPRKRLNQTQSPGTNRFEALSVQSLSPDTAGGFSIGNPAFSGKCGAPTDSVGAAHAKYQPHEGKNQIKSERRDPSHANFSRVHSRNPKPRNPAANDRRQAVRPVKLEKTEKSFKLEENTSSFYTELKDSAPDLFASLVQQAESEDQKNWFCCELAATPPLGEVNQSDLSDFTVQRELYSALGQASGFDQEVEIKLEFIKSIKLDGANKKKFFYNLSCTQESALENITSCAQLRTFKFYKISFASPRESICGVRFQLPIDRNPEPFKSYSPAQWLQVIATQGLDPSLVLTIQIGTRFSIGEPICYTGMLDIYLKHDCESTHGCDGALLDGSLTKQILVPPANILLGRNPNPESEYLIDNDLLCGQYHSQDPSDPPGITSNLMEDEVKTEMDPSNYGKMYIRPLIKPGHCKYCWTHTTNLGKSVSTKMCVRCV